MDRTWENVSNACISEEGRKDQHHEKLFRRLSSILDRLDARSRRTTRLGRQD